MASPIITFAKAKPLFLAFHCSKIFCKVKIILPALADPAAVGDPVYPVLLALPQKSLNQICKLVHLAFAEAMSLAKRGFG